MSSIPTPIQPLTQGKLTAEAAQEQLSTHLKQTARFIRGLDITILICGWLAMLMITWLAGSVVDHWLFALPVVLRWIIWIAAVSITLWYLLTEFAPLLIRKINPTYAAKRIEQIVPEFKNGLIAWLELQSMPDHGVPKGVMAALSYRAVRFIGGYDPSSTVDTGPLVKRAGAVLFLVVALTIYGIFSPKSLLESGKRLAFPWLSTAAPTRVHILEVSPGTTEITYGAPLIIAAEVRGVRQDELIFVCYNTLDGQYSNQRTAMSAEIEGRRYAATVKSGELGLEHEIEYWIEAGDAIGKRYRVALSPLPAVAIDRVRVEFPKYTGLEPREFAANVDIEGLEGSKLIVWGSSNQKLDRARLVINPQLKSSGHIDQASEFFDMKIDSQTAHGECILFPSKQSFCLNGYNSRGESNVNPVIRPLNVYTDVPPEVLLVGPEDRIVKVSPTSRLRIEVRANDPDFGLSKVQLDVRLNRLMIHSKQLLENAENEPEPVLSRVMTTELDVAKLKVAAGDRIELTALAFDNRHDPTSQALSPNQQQSAPLILEVVAPQKAEIPPELQPKPSEPKNSANQNSDKPKQQPSDRNESDDPKSSSNETERADSSSEPNDSNDASQRSESPNSEPANAAQDKSDEPNSSSNQKDGDKENSKPSSTNQENADPSNSSEKQGSPKSEQQGGSKESDSSESGEKSGKENPAGSQRNQTEGKGDQNSKSSSDSRTQKQPGNSNEAKKQNSNERSSDPSKTQSNQNTKPEARNQSEQATQNENSKTNSKTEKGSQANPPKPTNSKSDESSKSPDGNSQPEHSKESAANGESSSKDDGPKSASQPSEQQRAKDEETLQKVKEFMDKQKEQENSKSNGSQEDSKQESGKQESGKQESGKQESGKQESGKQESGKQESGKQESGKQESGKQESGKQESGKQESGKQESGKQESGKQESGKQESGKQESGKQESGKQESGKQESGKQESSKQKSGKQESGKQESGKQESGKQESGKQESGKQESGKQESGKQESGKQESGKQESGKQESGKQESGKQESGSEGEKGTKGSEASQSTGKQSKSETNSGSGTSNQGGQGADVGSSVPTDPNFAKQTTDLTLDYLKRQRQQPDPELLKQLNWSEKDLRDFVDRYQSAKDLSATADPLKENKEELASLRSGKGMGNVGASGAADAYRDQLDSGSRQRPPENLRRKVEAFQEALKKTRP